jgi:hypothetical protein
MANDLATPQTFEQRVFTRMRENIGELMTDEEMRKLLDTTIERMFFTEKKIPGRNYNSDTTEPPEIYKLVRELVEPQLKKALAEYLTAHAAEVAKAIDTALAGGIVEAYSRALARLTEGSMQALQGQLFQTMTRLDRTGVPQY